MYFLDLDLFGLFILFIVLCIITRILYKNETKEKIIWRYILCGYIVIIIKIAIFPICLGRFERDWDGYDIIQLVPFNTITQIIKYGNWIQILGNICLLMPIPILAFKIKGTISKSKLLIRVLSISVGIEFIQYLIFIVTNYPSRIVDIDDIILNTIGGMICIYFIVPTIKKKTE